MSNKRVSLLYRCLFGGILGFAVFLAQAYTPIALPEWSDQAGCQHHLYLFTQDSTTPGPELSTNIFGAPGCVVTLGSMATGWHFGDTLSGEPGHGAWDLGKGSDGGAITITLPIGNSSTSLLFGSYTVKLRLNAVGHLVFYALPSLEVVGHELASVTMTDSLAYSDAWGDWKNRTWNAEITGVTTDTITVKVIAAESGSLLDAIELYAVAEVVPGPSTALGTPIAWYTSRDIDILPGTTWDEVDYYDLDGDGMLNWEEFVAGTDPLDANSVFKIITLQHSATGEVAIQWLGGTNGATMPYQIQYTPTLHNPVWQTIDQVPRSTGINTWTGTQQTPQGYYRLNIFVK